MRRLAWWASRLYPAAWRERYGAEFEALLEDTSLQGGDVWDVLWGALTMRMTRSNLVAITAGLAVIGGLIGGLATLGNVAGYTSTGTLRVKVGDKDPATEIAAFQMAMQKTMSRGSLAELIQRPNLDLYRDARAKDPLEDIILRMRHDIAVRHRATGAGRTALTVSFRHPDPVLAQRANAALMERLRSEMVAQVPVEVMEQASPGQSMLTGKRWQIVATGMLAGLGLGIACSMVWSVVRNRQRWNLRRIGTFTVAGTVLGIGIAMNIPDVFISTAVVRTDAQVDPATLNRTLVSDEALGEIIHSQGLYAHEMANRPLADVVRRMKQDIQLRVADPQPFQPLTVRAYTISFRDHDRARAQQVTRALILSWLKAGLGTQVTTEVLDPPSSPASPSSPNRLTITMVGTLAGLLLGLAAARIRRSPAGGLVPNGPSAA
jgi:hypothetical protein